MPRTPLIVTTVITVNTAPTRASATSVKCLWIRLQATIGNQGLIYHGDKNVNNTYESMAAGAGGVNYPPTGQGPVVHAYDLSDLYFAADNIANNDKVIVTYMLR
jgi:hypothetical protein